MVLVTVVLVLFLPRSASASPPPYAVTKCLEPTVLPGQPLVEGGAQDEIIRRAGKLALHGRLDAAQELYELALASHPPDPRAGRGLAYVQARRLAAANCVARAEQTRATDPAVAEAMLRQALAFDAGNKTARESLVTPPSDDRSAAQKAADRWDVFFKSWVDPVIRLVVPALIALAVLLVLARALTSSVVRTKAAAWGKWSRRVVWTVGFGLLVFAAAQAVSLAVDSHPLVALSTDQWLAVALTSIVLLGAAMAVRVFSLGLFRSTDAEAGRTSVDGVLLAAAVAGVVALIAIAAKFWAADAPEVWSWTFAVALACLGVVLVAAARGQALRLLVQVKTDGKDDPSGTAYVLARLQELGTAPPEGLKTPQQLDVDNLPSEALKSLPVGRVASALGPLLKVVLPATPWKAVVEAEDQASRIVVTVTRNGAVVRTALVDADRFLPKPQPSETVDLPAQDSGVMAADVSARDTADRGDLLTAAAAVVLTELAQVHTQLKEGLCGASRWESVAAQVVATKPPSTAGGSELRRELLAYAVQADPPNALAQLAYANLQGREATKARELCSYAARLTGLLDRIEQQAGLGPVRATVAWDREHPPSDTEVWQWPPKSDRKRAPGYLPLRLRARHELTATWMNVAVESVGSQRWKAVDAAAINYRALVYLLFTATGASSGGDAGAFVKEMSRVAAALQQTFGPLTKNPTHPVQLPDPPPAGDPGELPSLHVRYDKACRLAALRQDDEAARELERAAGLEGNRIAARTDPWFGRLRRAEGSPDAVEVFWKVVGSPNPAFTDLPPFGKKGSALRQLGVVSAPTLIAITPDRGEALAKALDIPTTVVAGWWEFACLAEPRAGRKRFLDNRELLLLAEVGIRSDRDLTTRVCDDGLAGELVRKADHLGLRPPTPAEVRQMLAPRSDPAPGRPGPRARRVAGQRRSRRAMR
jgi:hypothetical protein